MPEYIVVTEGNEGLVEVLCESWAAGLPVLVFVLARMYSFVVLDST